MYFYPPHGHVGLGISAFPYGFATETYLFWKKYLVVLWTRSILVRLL